MQAVIRRLINAPYYSETVNGNPQFLYTLKSEKNKINYSSDIPHSTFIVIRAVADLFLGNLALAGFRRICKANPAGAGASFHHIISHQ